jgi:glycine cleavage system H protein
MSNPSDLKYHEAHTWLKAEAEGAYSVGITDHAQEQLGDVVYVEPPAVGSTIKQGEACGVIESVKTAADIHAPASGMVIAVNPALADAPEAVNSDPYGTWLFRMTLSDSNELAALLDVTAYEKVLA